MQITLSKDLEEFVVNQLRSGTYADAGRLVQDAPENLREAMPDPASEQMLLEAHQSPATPLTAEDFRGCPAHASGKPEQGGMKDMLKTSPFQNHLLFRRATESGVTIDRLIHGARDLPRRLPKTSPNTP